MHQFNSYEQAIEHLCVLNFIDWDHSQPMETLQKIISIEITMAIDPRISKLKMFP